MSLCVLGVDPGTILLLGGGARSKLWAQIRADVMGMHVEVPSRVDTSALGAAMLAAVAADIQPDLATCANLVAGNSVFTDPVGAHFSVWQRGTTIDSTTTYPNDNGKYVIDQWVLLMGNGAVKPGVGVGVVDLDRVATIPSLAYSPYSCRITGNANVGGTPEKFGLFQMKTAAESRRLRNDVVSVALQCQISAGSGMNKLQMAVVSSTRPGTSFAS